MKKRLLISLGGNALEKEGTLNYELIDAFAFKVANLVKQGYEIILNFGNGPQIGHLYNALTLDKYQFNDAGRMIEGYIAYALILALKNAFLSLELFDHDVYYFSTKPIVNLDDLKNLEPIKPLGKPVLLDERKKNAFYKAVSRTHFQQMIVSPSVLSLLNINALKNFNFHNQVLLIGTSGSIPLAYFKDSNKYQEIDAVCDKDEIAGFLAHFFCVDALIILTSVPSVFFDFGFDHQTPISFLTLEKWQALLDQNYFEKGTIAPKIKACYEFVKNNKDSLAYITDLDGLNEDDYLSSRGTTFKKE